MTNREKAVFEIIIACLCFVVGGMFISEAFLSYFSYESQVLNDWNPPILETIVGVIFIIIGSILIWESEKIRYN